MLPIADRASAGRELANALRALRGRQDAIVLALPRGGVPVGYEIAETLGLEFDLLLVRKLGVPWHRELAMGAIASGGIVVLNDDVIGSVQISESELAAAVEREQQELERRSAAYRGTYPWPDLGGRSVIVVDDGVATGATMKAGLAAVRQQRPQDIRVAVPVAPVETVDELRSLADEVFCLETPSPFFSIGEWYEDFRQIDDAEVRKLLQRAWQRVPTASSEGESGDSRRVS